MFRRSLLWLLPATLPALAATFVLWPSSHNAHATCFGGNPTYSAWSDVVPTGIPVYHRITWISSLGCSPDCGAIDWTFEQYATAYSPYQTNFGVLGIAGSHGTTVSPARPAEATTQQIT